MTLFAAAVAGRATLPLLAVVAAGLWRLTTGFLRRADMRRFRGGER